ncbi:MAG: hypothetical protein JWO08_4273 [Verrucomicrobiaceae bacterium]|nr:hypothetical protein [Verrucomicrobiaceae bacterium]
MNDKTRLARIFSSASLDVGECSLRTGIPSAWVWDLLGRPDEMESNCSLQMIRSLATYCNVRPSAFFTDPPYQGAMVSEAELHGAITATLERDKMPYEEFSDKVGWHLKDDAGEWVPLSDWCVDQLRAVCECVNVEWLDVIEGLPGEDLK